MFGSNRFILARAYQTSSYGHFPPTAPAATPMSTQTGSDRVLDVLAAEGTTTLFGLIGEGNTHLIDAINGHALDFEYARHEQAAVTMADGYARVTDEVGVCTLTHGPGVTNGATGLAAADRDNVPLVVVIGDTAFAGRETSLQYLDHQTFTTPVSVYQTRVETPATIGETLRRAFETARTERGPAVVELPGDIQTASVSAPPYEPAPSTARDQRIRPAADRLTAAATALEAAERPAILAGGGARSADAGPAVARLAERIGAPLATTYYGKGLVDHDHPLHTGIAGTFMTQANDALLWDTDLLVAVGAQLSGKSTRYGELYADADVVQIDTAPAAIGRHQDPAVGVVADAKAAVEALAEAVEPAPDRARRVRATVDDAGRAIPFTPESTDRHVDPRALTQALSAMTANDAVVAVDSGNNTGFPAVLHTVDAGGRMLVNGNFGTMGYAVPAAIGAAYADPDRDVVCYTGDGGLMQVLQEIETAVRLSLPILFVVLNDASYGIIRHRQHREFARGTASDYDSPAFATIADGLGARSTVVRSTAELDTIETFLAGDPSVPLVVDARTNPEVSRPGFPPY